MTNIYLKPTYLYIKQHTKTGLLYFGKTVNDPNKYHGSGKRWVKHIKKHGKQYIETLWISEIFTDPILLKETALRLSNYFDVVNSKQWANIIPENGINGGGPGLGFGSDNPFYGKTHSKETKEILSKYGKNRIISKESSVAGGEKRKGENNGNFGGSFRGTRFQKATGEYKIYFITGKIIEITGFIPFCKEFGYSHGSLSRLLTGKIMKYRDIIKIERI